MYFLDSCVCIDLMRGRLPVTYSLMRGADPASFGIPAVVLAELRTGCAKSNDPARNGLTLDRFVKPYAIVPFDEACACAYARTRASLERRGEKIGPNDLLIAATALAHQAVLVTSNTREFQRVDGLAVECWDDTDI